MALEELVLHLMNVGAYAIVLMFGITITKTLYGGKFSSSLPYLVAALFLIFLASIVNLFLFFLPESASAFIIKASVHLLTIIAGVLLLLASYKFYLLKYATSGVMKRMGRGFI